MNTVKVLEGHGSVADHQVKYAPVYRSI